MQFFVTLFQNAPETYSKQLRAACDYCNDFCALGHLGLFADAGQLYLKHNTLIDGSLELEQIITFFADNISLLIGSSHPVHRRPCGGRVLGSAARSSARTGPVPPRCKTPGAAFGRPLIFFPKIVNRSAPARRLLYTDASKKGGRNNPPPDRKGEAVCKMKYGSSDCSRAIGPRFDELYTRYRDEALRTASLITGSRADGEDVVQEAFVQCYQRIGQLRDRSKFKAWLFTLLTRTAWKYCRKRGREEPVSEFFDDAEKAGESALGAVLRTRTEPGAFRRRAGAR